MPRVETVLGPIKPREMGFTLPHEHVMVDFVGADKTGPERWNRDEVAEVMRPLLETARKRGVRTLVECTPQFLARDPELLRRLSRETGLHLITNTGLYKEPFLPPYAFEETPKQLSARWVREAEKGIDGTGIRPGFIKIAVNAAPLAPTQRKIVTAAALTHKETGLRIACHTGGGPAALECLEILESEGVPGTAHIVVHIDGESDRAWHRRIAERGAWLSYDGVGGRPIEQHVSLVRWALENRLRDHVLLSHDAGWYNVGEPRGGKQRGFTDLQEKLLPALRLAGIAEWDLIQLTEANPQRAFTIP